MLRLTMTPHCDFAYGTVQLVNLRHDRVRARGFELRAVAGAPQHADRRGGARVTCKHIVLAVADHHRCVRARARGRERAAQRDFLRLDGVVVPRRVDDGDMRAQADFIDEFLGNRSELRSHDGQRRILAQLRQRFKNARKHRRFGGRHRAVAGAVGRNQDRRECRVETFFGNNAVKGRAQRRPDERPRHLSRTRRDTRRRQRVVKRIRDRARRVDEAAVQINEDGVKQSGVTKCVVENRHRICTVRPRRKQNNKSAHGPRLLACDDADDGS